jgi:hypothetical protein
VNAHLGASPFRLQSGSIGRVTVSIPYTALLSDSVVLELRDVEVVLLPTADMPPGEETDRPGDSSDDARSEEEEQRDVEAALAGVVAAGAFTVRSDWDDAARDGRNVISGFLQRMVGQMKVQVVNVRVALGVAALPSRLVVAIGSVEAWDCTPGGVVVGAAATAGTDGSSAAVHVQASIHGVQLLLEGVDDGSGCVAEAEAEAGRETETTPVSAALPVMSLHTDSSPVTVRVGINGDDAARRGLVPVDVAVFALQVRTRCSAARSAVPSSLMS